MKTQIAEVEVSELVYAKWNYKTDGTEEQIKKLEKAITEAGSCGVIAVRQINFPLEDGSHVTKLEVMDGNHRLKAITNLGWTKVTVENFGEITQARAIILTRQRNQNWFDDDKLKLANLFTEHVFPEYDKEFLQSILPETLESLNTLEMLANPEWLAPVEEKKNNGNNGGSRELDKKLLIQVDEETLNLWAKVKERFKEVEGLTSDARIFEFLMTTAMAISDEELGIAEDDE